MPRFLRDAVREGLKNINAKYEPRPPIDPEFKKRLQAEFASEVEQLSELLGRDLTLWSR